MPRILFVDDDPAEIDSFDSIVAGFYDCTSVLWPKEAEKLRAEKRPDLIVSDLYLPPQNGDATVADEEKERISGTATRAAESFSRIATEKEGDDKQLLREMMAAISIGQEMLNQQWTAMGQSPDHGVAVLRRLEFLYPGVPFVFYSRKITPEDVVRVLREGAADAIRKGALTREQVLNRLDEALRLAKSRKPEPESTPQATKSEGEPLQLEPSMWTSRGSGFAVRPTVYAPWIEAGTKAVGLVTGLFAFMLARGKFLDWLHSSHGQAPAILRATSGSGAIAVLIALYLIVHFLFVTGSVLERISTELMNACVSVLRYFPSVKAKLTSDLADSLKKSVPRMVGVSWDACVLVLAVIPAVRLTIALLLASL